MDGLFFSVNNQVIWVHSELQFPVHQQKATEHLRRKRDTEI